jgi:hypothetical protein
VDVLRIRPVCQQEGVVLIAARDLALKFPMVPRKAA